MTPPAATAFCSPPALQIHASRSGAFLSAALK
eukprot:CAMPEP_0114157116 /NCGR_PEP_ID=MMETSP0043_2-20121206/26440_1 /TAXON_ID=464988 /ORGANISM="Hemiselmis andersenii, Strain CCMP644" /LENGTH=31 /DNA_ID= /DNA_START= /DNA_END= /DNA_ORIENTATION=